MNKLPKNPIPFSLKGCYLAGGSILSIVTKSEVADYDLYPKSKDDMINIFHELQDNNCFVVNFSDRAVTWKCNDLRNEKNERTIFQVMTFDNFDSPEKIFDFFDFSVCMAAFDGDSEEYHFHPNFWPSVASRTLYFNPNTRYPLNSVIRVGKYTSKGYYLPKAESVKMSLSVINNGMPQSWDELEDAIGGAYGRQMRLDVGTREFSYENALDLLDNMVFDFSYFESESDHSFIKAEHLEEHFNGNTQKIFKIDSNFTGKTVTLVNDILLMNVTMDDEKAMDILQTSTEYLDPETIVTGYMVMEHEDGDIWKKKLAYGTSTLYEMLQVNKQKCTLYKTKEYAKNVHMRSNSKVGRFSFCLKNLESVSSYQYTVNEVFFEGIEE